MKRMAAARTCARLALRPCRARQARPRCPAAGRRGRARRSSTRSGPPVAPQLTNRKPWRAKPILVSGTTAYRKGEFLYQDFLYDDTGARLAFDPNDPRTAGNLFSKPNGTYTYPTAEDYANNAADLVELRVKRLRRATAFRVTLNTLKDPALVAFSIAIGGNEGELAGLPVRRERPGARRALPHRASRRRSDGRRADDGGRRRGREPKAPRARVTAAGARSRCGSRTAPGTRAGTRSGWRPASACGTPQRASTCCRDPPRTRARRAAAPRAAAVPRSSTSPSAATSRSRRPPTTRTRSSTPRGGATARRATRLRPATSRSFFAKVSFSKLARRVRDNSRVPKTGPMDRIYGSRFELSQGADFCVTSA